MSVVTSNAIGNAYRYKEENMSESDREQLVNLTDELLMTDNLETIQEIAWGMKEILNRNKSENLLNLAKSLMSKEAERLGCL